MKDIDKDYEPFGPEWEKEMMKMSKKMLIQFIQDTRKINSMEVEKAFSDGYESATKEAQQEIAKNYHPNR